MSRVEINANETSEFDDLSDKSVEDLLQDFYDLFPELQEESLSDFKLTNAELEQTINNIRENEYIIAHIDLEEPNDPIDNDATIHSNADGNTVVTMPIIEGPINPITNQIIISEVEYGPAKPKISKLHNNTKAQILVHIGYTQ